MHACLEVLTSGPASLTYTCTPLACTQRCRYDDYAFERIAESAFGRSARAGRLEQVSAWEGRRRVLKGAACVRLGKEGLQRTAGWCEARVWLSLFFPLHALTQPVHARPAHAPPARR